MTGSRIFHTIRRLFVIPFVFSFSLRSQRPSCRGIAVEPPLFPAVIAVGRGDASVAYIHVYHPWSFVAGTVGGYPCSARSLTVRRPVSSSTGATRYREPSMYWSVQSQNPVRGIGTPCGASAVLPSSRPPAAALPCSRSSPCAAPRPFHLFPAGACRKETAVGRNGRYGHEQGELYGTQEHRLVGAVSGRGGQRKVGIDMSRKSRMDGVCQARRMDSHEISGESATE